MIWVKETAKCGSITSLQPMTAYIVPRPAPVCPIACTNKGPGENPLHWLPTPPWSCDYMTELHASVSLTEKNMIGNDVIGHLISWQMGAIENLKMPWKNRAQCPCTFVMSLEGFHFHLKVFLKYSLKKGKHHKEGRLNMTPNWAIPKKEINRAVPIL